MRRPLSRGEAEAATGAGAGAEGSGKAEGGGGSGGARLDVMPEARQPAGTGRLAVDVAFASLGWVCFAGRQPYRLRARPVEGAAAYARTPFYEFDEAGRIV